MLVLSRKIGESILVPGHGMTIQIVGIRGGNVKIGITAPPETKILRKEVLERDQREAQLARAQISHIELDHEELEAVGAH